MAHTTTDHSAAIADQHSALSAAAQHFQKSLDSAVIDVAAKWPLADMAKMLNTASLDVPTAESLGRTLRHKADVDRAALETALRTGQTAEFLRELVDDVDHLADRVEEIATDRTRWMLTWVCAIAAVIAAVGTVILVVRAVWG